jgi:SAM-dependent methyltransferase
VTASIGFFDSLASEYDAHFQITHRRAYDELAWEVVAQVLPDLPGRVVDLGCGIGRWVPRFLALGHRVVGIEQSPAMAAAAIRRFGENARFTLIEGDMCEVELPEGAADCAVAMGSVQYAGDPNLAIKRMGSWTKPGGTVCILVDSLLALIADLIRRGEFQEALDRLHSRTGRWVMESGLEVDQYLFDAEELRNAVLNAGLVDVQVRGLLVSSSVMSVEMLTTELERDWSSRLNIERQLSARPELADLGKQLLAWGHKPDTRRPTASRTGGSSNRTATGHRGFARPPE